MRSWLITVVAGRPSEFRYMLSTTTLKLGTATFNVSNAGSVPHDFFVCSVPSDGTANTCAGTGTPLNGGTLIEIPGLGERPITA